MPADAKSLSPVDCTHHFLDFRTGHAAAPAIACSNERSHTCTGDAVDRDIQVLEHAQDADVSSAPGSATAEHDTDPWTAPVSRWVDDEGFSARARLAEVQVSESRKIAMVVGFAEAAHSGQKKLTQSSRSAMGLRKVSGLKRSHLVEFLESGGAEVFFVYQPAVTDHEGLHSRYAILRRSTDQRKAADHRALDDKVHLTEGHAAGPGQPRILKKVTVIWLGAAGIQGLFDGIRDRLAYRSIPFSSGVFPRQAVLLFAGSADDPLGILRYVIPLAFLQGIFTLPLPPP